MQLIKKGAEADIFVDGGAIVKVRKAKKYRTPQLDERLRAERTRAEAKLLERAAFVIDVPKILGREDFVMPGSPSHQAHHGDFSIRMEHIYGKRVKDIISKKNYPEICSKIGRHAARLHNAHIVHGDLTTSNMILSSEKVYFIDFGLGFFSCAAEDMAVDLRLLEEAFLSTHQEIAADAMASVLEAYERSGGKKDVVERLEKIRLRARYARK